MESLITFICEHSHQAHWIIFILLLLAGLNIPLSEDLLLIAGGVIASTCFEKLAHFLTLRLFFFLYLGCWISAWEAYWIGRLLGPKLYEFRWFKSVLTKKKVSRLHFYYEKFGFLTFLLGRFIPGGVRNALFMTSGLGKMPFGTFILRDGMACLISSLSIFFLGYLFGENYPELIILIKKYEIFLISLLAVFFICLISFYFFKKKKISA